MTQHPLDAILPQIPTMPSVFIALTHREKLKRVLSELQPGAYAYYDEIIRQCIKRFGGTYKQWQTRLSQIFPGYGQPSSRLFNEYFKGEDKTGFTYIGRLKEEWVTYE